MLNRNSMNVIKSLYNELEDRAYTIYDMQDNPEDYKGTLPSISYQEFIEARDNLMLALSRLNIGHHKLDD